MEGIAFKVFYFLYIVSFVIYVLYAVLKKELFARLGRYVLIGGFVVQTIYVVLLTIHLGRLPLANLYEFMLCFIWSIILSYLIIEHVYKLNILGAFVLPIPIIFTLYLSTIPHKVGPLMPALKSYWLTFHVLMAILAYGPFTIAFGIAILYLVKEYLLKKKSASSLNSIIPELEVLDKINYQTIAFAFPFMTLLIITGGIWAEEAWGTYWSWDPKETWSLITWLMYAAYLHARLILGWNGRRTAILTIVGFLSLMFTYLGVSKLLPGLHSYK